MDDVVQNSEHFEQRGELFPIRTVSSLTGVNAVTLRAWERRYRLIRPKRTGSGHRLYDQQDIDRIRRAVSLVDKGMSISQAAQLINQQGDTPTARHLSDEQWEEYRRRSLEAIEALDETALAESWGELFAHQPLPTLVRMLIGPLLERTAPANEAEQAGYFFFLGFLRNKLVARYHYRSRNNRGPMLVWAPLDGEVREIEALLFALAAHEKNYRLLMPATNQTDVLSRAADRVQAAAVVVFPGLSRDAAGVGLVDRLGIPVLAGGEGARQQAGAWRQAGYTVLEGSLDEQIQHLEEALASRPHRFDS